LKQTNDILPLKKQTIMNTMEDVKNRLDKVYELAINPIFVEHVYHAVKSQGCSEEEWQSNMMPIVARLAYSYLERLDEESK